MSPTVFLRYNRKMKNNRKTLGRLILDASIALQHSEASLSSELQWDLRRLWKLAEAFIDVDDISELDAEAALLLEGYLPRRASTDYEQ